MTYKECTEYILSIPLFAEKLGLDHLNSILEIMNHPERDYPVIHVAGTNGKGSTCAFLGSILHAKGYRVGIFTSPHLIRINERIRIDDHIISDDDFCEVFHELKKYIEKAGEMGIPHPSFFEYIFLMSALYFSRQKVDYVIFETGMGGRLDATNVVCPRLCIITSIGLDHMQYLGDTISEIAAEKAGIIKPGIPVIYFDRDVKAARVITNKCVKNRAFLHIVEKKQYNLLKITKKTIDFSFQSEYYRYDNLRIKKTALYQIENAVLAIQAYELLLTGEMMCDIDNTDSEDDGICHNLYHKYIHRDIDIIRKGLYEMIWQGRMEKIADHVYVDGAHNEEAIEAFCHTIETMFKTEQKNLLFAVSKDKNYRDMIERLCRIPFNEIIIVKYKGDRSADLDAVEDTFRKFSDSKITTFEDIEAGYEYGKAHVKDQFLFCVGSLYLVGNLLDLGV